MNYLHELKLARMRVHARVELDTLLALGKLLRQSIETGFSQINGPMHTAWLKQVEKCQHVLSVLDTQGIKLPEAEAFRIICKGDWAASFERQSQMVESEVVVVPTVQEAQADSIEVVQQPKISTLAWNWFSLRARLLIIHSVCQIRDAGTQISQSNTVVRLVRRLTPDSVAKWSILLISVMLYAITMIRLADNTQMIDKYLALNLAVSVLALVFAKLRWVALHGAILSGLAIMNAGSGASVVSLYIYMVSFLAIWFKKYTPYQMIWSGQQHASNQS